ncbi:hypothetical protein BD324DRAFT_651527 [Kockovaella imperatae]|uniref:Alpha-ketoglutarate-dependent dioxygenase AlkB-like domain-containing protein n=1 Tax=Kockovaella imperatae TaxID=4999 RepID=A0A1Y1UGT7_9TREE|nr:hypothetical protein BD324DRAFT_651527 [Kockovaella imperatae]ORX36285.1 hypothetical protein BD324DRAFT_651527 [Kockovaella imperatae]
MVDQPEGRAKRVKRLPKWLREEQDVDVKGDAGPSSTPSPVRKTKSHYSKHRPIKVTKPSIKRPDQMSKTAKHQHGPSGCRHRRATLTSEQQSEEISRSESDRPPIGKVSSSTSGLQLVAGLRLDPTPAKTSESSLFEPIRSSEHPSRPLTPSTSKPEPLVPPPSTSLPDINKGKPPDGAQAKSRERIIPPEVHDNERITKTGYPSSRFCKVLRIIARLSHRDAEPLDISPTARQQGIRPQQRPPVWAESRQELCETLPYYRAFQSGLYMSKGTAYGYLLEAFPAPRDVWALDGKVIISHGGGQCTRIEEDHPCRQNQAVLAADQSPTDARVETLINAWKRSTPIVLIAGEGYQQLPWKLGCAYAVLGWYWISYVWVEAEPVARGIKGPSGRDYFHRYKVRFDWVESQGQPWWINKKTEREDPLERVTLDSEGLRERIKIDRLCASSNGHNARCLDALRLDLSTKRTEAIFDPTTGLLTPPITPPQKAVPSLTAEAPATDISPTQSQPMSQEEFSCKLIGEPRQPERIFLQPFLPLEDLLNECSDCSESDDDDDLSGGPLSSKLARMLPGNQLLRSKAPFTRSEPIFNAYVDRSKICPSCGVATPQVYIEGWMCLSPTCHQFWMLSTTIGFFPLSPGFKLSYHPDFLEPVSCPPGLEHMPYDVVPALPEEPTQDAGSGSLLRGWVCDRCGRANCRYRWDRWECVNCKNIKPPPLNGSHTTSAASLQSLCPAYLGDAAVHSDSGIGVNIETRSKLGLTIMVYALPREAGTIYHVLSNRSELADGLWEKYQAAASQPETSLFERRSLRSAAIKGALLAQHFAINSGKDYKYNVATASLPFDQSPSCILDALTYIRSVSQTVLNSRVDFNEILSVIYREGQKMSWHDDGEEGERF